MNAANLDLPTEHNVNQSAGLVLTTTGISMTEHLKASIKQDLSARLMRIVWSWHHKDRYQDLQGAINKAVDNYNVIIEQDVERIVTRRDALRSLVNFSVETCILNTALKAKDPIEDVLAQCAAGITACWYFRKGKELFLANDALKVYIPALKTIMDTANDQRKSDIAALLVQCYLLKGTLARHMEGCEQSMTYLKQADEYSKVARNTTLDILTARTIAAAYDYIGQPGLALRYAEKAKSLITRETPLQLQSFVFAGLATYYAENNHTHEARASLGMAYKTFSREDSVVWVDHTLSNLLSNDGETHYHLGEQRKSIETYSQITKLPSEDSTVVGRHSAYTNLAKAEVSRDDQPRDMDYCIDFWTQGIQGAHELHSEIRFSQSRQVYDMLRAAWPGEQRVKGLRDLLVHW
jgi:tetratricopeptide (TPR) repeat protein